MTHYRSGCTGLPRSCDGVGMPDASLLPMSTEWQRGPAIVAHPDAQLDRAVASLAAHRAYLAALSDQPPE